MDLNALLRYTVENIASDLHISPGMPPLTRIDGSLLPIKEMPILTPSDTQALLYSILTPEQQTLFESRLFLEFAHVACENNFRVSVFHQMRGVGGVFRAIPSDIPSLDVLDIPLVLKQSLTISRGLILVSGPTGSGKSTTLAAIVNYINQYRVCNIITIEDPIEFVHQSKRCLINQIQIGRDTPDFATALRASLRQDPNVILLGELRDLETMRLALTAVETGHLVLATIHATSAPLAINRFADVFPQDEQNRVRTLLSETLEAVICQRLVKKKAGGRVAVFEVMTTTSAVKHYICRDMPAHMESAMQTSGDKGMFTLDQYLHELVVKRIINATVASMVLANRGTFKEGSEAPKK